MNACSCVILSANELRVVAVFNYRLAVMRPAQLFDVPWLVDSDRIVPIYYMQQLTIIQPLSG